MKRTRWIPLIVYAALLVAFLGWISNLFTTSQDTLPYSKVVELFNKEQVRQFVVQDQTITMQLNKPYNGQTTITAPLADPESFRQEMHETFAEQTASGVLESYNFVPDKGFSPYTLILPLLVVGLVILFVWALLMGRMSSAGNPMNGFSKARTVLGVPGDKKVTFDDVAGADEEKEELQEIVDFLKNPEKFTEIGARIPHGLLLVGPPGTGKTLLARAVAGEAGVQFLSISGSDFVEMYVGVGAGRVRDLFEQARKIAPAIVFIDEIDAVGRKRGSGLGGGHDEKEQTLNQLLVEMDGFTRSEGVIVLAATNRPDILDPALLRPGRFDRRVPVELPDLKGREAILQVHAKKIKVAEDVDFNKIARMASGASGAELANIVNEAALRAVRMGRKAVNQQDLLTSFELVIAGTEKKGTVLTDTEKRIVSYHEVGHALVAALQKHSQPVSKITIVPHTSGALGYTMQMPEEEKFLSSREELIVELQTMLGGRAAEQVVFGIATTGASNDIERATELARKMVTQYGMSDKLGLMALSTVSNPYLDGSTMMNCADSTSSAADEEIHKLLMDCYADAKKLLVEHRSLLDEIAMYLLSKETITGDEFMAYVNADSKRLTDGSEAEEPPEQTEAPSESE